MKSNQIYLSVLKTAIQKSLSKNLPQILEDAVQYLENHNFQRRKSLQKKTQSSNSKQIKENPTHQNAFLNQSDEKIESTIPYFNESDETGYDCPPTIPYFYFNESYDYKSATQEYDCPPESWEDIGCGEEEDPKLEIISMPSGYSDDLSIFDQLEGSLALNTPQATFDQSPDVQRQSLVVVNDAASFLEREESSFDRALKQTGAKWRAQQVNGECSDESRLSFFLYSSPCKREDKVLVLSASQKKKKDDDLMLLLE